MALVHEDLGIVLLREVADFLERRDVAIHREDAVCDDHSVPRAFLHAVLQLFLEVGHVHVVVPIALCLAETDAVDDRGVIQRIGDHGILGPEDGLEDAGVGIEAAGEEDGVLCAVELADGSLEILVDVLRAADEADRTQTKAVASERLLARLDQGRVARQTQVVVGAKVQHRPLPVLNGDHAGLWAGDDSLHLVGASLLHGTNLALEMFPELTAHGRTHAAEVLAQPSPARPHFGAPQSDGTATKGWQHRRKAAAEAEGGQRSEQ
mmetsp:Transcript_64028/g.165306  ORF Transcript_64028/g.165306 Transcript_64028/m.165306 type:complete len:265 (-) Transcript_64028:15-809(-)